MATFITSLSANFEHSTHNFKWNWLKWYVLSQGTLLILNFQRVFSRHSWELQLRSGFLLVFDDAKSNLLACRALDNRLRDVFLADNLTQKKPLLKKEFKPHRHTRTYTRSGTRTEGTLPLSSLSHAHIQSHSVTQSLSLTHTHTHTRIHTHTHTHT